MSNEIVISSGSIFFLSGSATSSNVFKEIIEKPQTVAAKWEIDPVDGKSIQLRIPSSSAGTNFDRIAFYISGSGKIGIGTKDPQSAFDIRDIGEDTEITSSRAKTELLKIDKDRGQEFRTAITASIISASSTISSTGDISTNSNFLGNNIGEIPTQQNKLLIFLTPNDFYPDSLTDYSRTAGPAIGGQGTYITDGGGRLTYTAIKVIPSGYQAVTASLKGNNQLDTFTIASSSWGHDSSGSALFESTINTASGITPIVGGNGIYCAVNWKANALARLYGGYIHLEKT